MNVKRGSSLTRLIRNAMVVACFAIFLAACGGGVDAATDPASAAIIEAAEANISQLAAAGPLIDIEVLDVADGQIATLGDTVDGERPVLLWFFSPH